MPEPAEAATARRAARSALRRVAWTVCTAAACAALAACAVLTEPTERSVTSPEGSKHAAAVEEPAQAPLPQNQDADPDRAASPEQAKLVAASHTVAAAPPDVVLSAFNDALAALFYLFDRFRGVLIPLIGFVVLTKIVRWAIRYRLYVYIGPRPARAGAPPHRDQALGPPEPAGPPMMGGRAALVANVPVGGVQFAYEALGGSEFTLELCETGTDRWTIYILRQPGYRTRRSGPASSHRYIDREGRPYVCWSQRLRSPDEAYAVARLWAEATEYYISTGRFVAPADLPDADPEPGSALAALLAATDEDADTHQRAEPADGRIPAAV